MSEPRPIARRYAAWVSRRRYSVLAFGLLIAVVGALLAARLPVHSDFSYLLPPESRSVKDLRALEKRVRTFGTVFVQVVGRTPEEREQASKALYDRLSRIDPEVLGHATYDDGVAREYFWGHRFLYADLDDLAQARDSIDDKLRKARLDANPLFVDLEDEVEDGADGEDRSAELVARLDEAERKVSRPAGFISKDGLSQLLILRSTAPTSRIDVSKRLLAGIEQAIEETRAEQGAGLVEVGLSGDVVSALHEHTSIMRGMKLAALITIALCALALFFYYRSMLPVVAALCALAVGTLATFGIARLTIGHLNVMTAFLAAIVVGNGVNSSLMLLARYFEEQRAGRTGVDQLARAIDGAAHGTLAAAIAAAVAYGSLVVTQFRGFRHFGWIGGIGMVLCWVAAFTVLPAALCVLRDRGWIKPSPEPKIGPWVSRLFPRRVAVTVAVAAAVTLVATVITWRFVAGDPMESDWRNLRSDSKELRQAHDWDERMGEQFDSTFKAGLSQRFVIGLDQREQAAPLARAFKQQPKSLIDDAVSIDDLLPGSQLEKLAILADIRRLLEDPGVADLDEDDQRTIDRIRPPPDLRPLTEADLPDELAWPFTEVDGSRGKLVLVSGSVQFQTWNVDDRVALAQGVRAMELPDGAVMGGQSFVIADIIASMERDGPLASIVAVLGAILAVWLVVGLRRHGAVTLLAGGVGIVGMVAMCALAGLKVNFLDLIALPITIGIGIDYSVNLAARERQSWQLGPRHILATTGGAVVLCSFTTIVGYGSLLLSENAGIRSFGLAAILGEAACLAAALLLTPALLAMLRRRAADRG
ncbi:MAG TPA: MMPL family transporter [Kofleriaceae bacterium]|nr:MMPL family transporter [Kofleriaceae bacterium]